jgi:phage shock protein E
MNSNTLLIVIIVVLIAAGGFYFIRSAAAADKSEGYADPAALAKLVAEKTEPDVLVDVRTPEEYAAGHIPGALNIPYDTIAGNNPAKEKDALVILYCRSGNRSGIAKRTLDAQGFTRVENFGAVGRWKG